MTTPELPPLPALTLVDKHHPLKRLIFGAVGLAIVLGVGWNLWPGLWPPTILTPFFGVIVAGSLWVGAIFFVSSVFGDNTVLRIDANGITLDRANPWRHRQTRLAPDEITRVIVHTHDWESRDETYEVRVILTSGAVIGSTALPDQAKAERLAEELRRRVS